MASDRTQRITVYDPVGVCIYCGSTGDEGGLGDEHVVPYSMGGNAVLPKASCRRCEGITSAFEGRCARTMYGSFRIIHGVQTRRPKQRPKHIHARATRKGVVESVLVPADGAISALPWVHFQSPGYMQNPQVREIGWTNAVLQVKELLPKSPKAWREIDAESVEFSFTFDIDSLARTLAKIAHAVTVGYLGVNAFNHWLPPYILGEDPHLSFLVGGTDGPLDPGERLHQIKCEVVPHMNEFLVTVQIRLFDQFGGPHALIIAGNTTKDRLDAREPKLKRIADT